MAECLFTNEVVVGSILKRVQDTKITYSQMRRTDKCS